jgi:predicted 2-oxoglutarate/Fe(II)-dependent dioxygenase YbiX
MFKYDVKDYVKIYDKCFDESFCNDSVQYLNQQTWNKHTMEDYDGNKVEHDTELSVLSNDSSMFTEHITNVIRKAVSRYILTDFKEYEEWFAGWNNYCSPRYNRYDVNTQMKLHCDHIHSLFDGKNKGIPTLSILGSLNNNYEGGEFILFNEYNIKLKAGQIIVFPSNFMYPHKVLPVKSGVRYTFVSWVW